MNKISTKCNGRLGDSYSMSLKLDTKQEKNTNIIDINFSINIDDINNRIAFIKNKSILKIKINDKEVIRNDIFLDFKHQDKYQINYTYKDVTNETKIVKIKGVLEVFDDSNYLENSTIEASEVLRIVEDKPYFIELYESKEQDNSTLTYTASPEFEFVEYKVGDSSWRIIKENSFKVFKTDRFQFVQVRGKLDSNYYYSNVIRISSKNLNI